VDIQRSHAKVKKKLFGGVTVYGCSAEKETKIVHSMLTDVYGLELDSNPDGSQTNQEEPKIPLLS